jgi:hypothetical protein
MQLLKTIRGFNIRSLVIWMFIPLMFNCKSSNNHPSLKSTMVSSLSQDPGKEIATTDDYPAVSALMVLPKKPTPGQPFRILATGGENLRKAQILLSGPSGTQAALKSKTGEEMPYWRIDDFAGNSEGKYKVALVEDKKVILSQEFTISPGETVLPTGVIWKTLHGWDSNIEAIYSAWINSLFHDCDEHTSWSALHEVTQNKNQNFLFNYLSLGEDDAGGKNKVIMQPDCADNPFCLRAYFAWKLGLPFGYHECDRGYIGRNPKTGRWITNESASSKTNPVFAFNSFIRKVIDGVHSGTARTALDDENSDYYPVPLERKALRPGTVFADPYGHTLMLIGWISQTKDHPGLLLSVDAQPDGTVGIKRFWKGNFLFNTSEVIGEPGFKAFRPISVNEGALKPVQNKSMTVSSGFAPYSLQQRKMRTEVFYHIMDRLINPKPLDPEAALLDLIEALHEQLMVRITSVANGEAYLKSHPGEIIPMPSSATAIFLAGGQWENFSTPNRDLRLLIAIDAVLDFPDLVASSPQDFNISGGLSIEQIKKKLQELLDQKGSELSITYIRTNGSPQKLTVGEILKRRDAFEMAYNPNDGIEVRWGAPENSEESVTCRRHVSPHQLETMRSVRVWFHKRLHPPT